MAFDKENHPLFAKIGAACRHCAVAGKAEIDLFSKKEVPIDIKAAMIYHKNPARNINPAIPRDLQAIPPHFSRHLTYELTRLTIHGIKCLEPPVLFVYNRGVIRTILKHIDSLPIYFNELLKSGSVLYGNMRK